MSKLFFITSFLFLSQNVFAAHTIYVTGRGFESTYCSANSGYYCLDNAKLRARSVAEREARFSCEVSYRGRALSYAASCYANCNPSYLPVNHDALWVSCNADCNMQCEVEN